ncbi:MAG: hypothetical protein CMJ64_06465 [Planctomycetaceae bacterium]|nr:hypothetical protein [Planctomycetaceae bacterium]
MPIEQEIMTPNPYESPSETNGMVVTSGSNRTLGRWLSYGGFTTASLSGCALLFVATPQVFFGVLIGVGVSVIACLAGVGILFADAFQKLRSVSRRSSLCLLIAVSLVNVCRAEDWPHWRGLKRDDVSSESSGWDGKAWPLKQLWKTSVGQGSTSPIVVANRLYTVGWSNGNDHVQCLDLTTGKPLWTMPYECQLYGRNSEGDKGIYAGVCSTPEFDSGTGLLHTLSIDGDLHAWDTQKQGRRVWSLNLYDRYRAPKRARVNRSGRRDYGYTTSPLVHGDWVIVEVGALEGTIIAFDKRTGKQRWASQAKVAAGHTGGLVPIKVEGVPCAAVHTFEGLLVVRLDGRNAGKTVATYPWKTDFANNIATPAAFDNNIVLTSAYNHHKIARLRITLRGAEKVWEQDYASKVCSPVIVGGHLYWAFQKLHCLDFETGELQWRGGNFGSPGSCIATSDQRLIVWGKQGDLVLTETASRSATKYVEVASRKGLLRKDAWPHVVLSDGKLLCKDRDGNLVCLAFER